MNLRGQTVQLHFETDSARAWLNRVAPGLLSPAPRSPDATGPCTSRRIEVVPGRPPRSAPPSQGCARAADGTFVPYSVSACPHEELFVGWKRAGASLSVRSDASRIRFWGDGPKAETPVALAFFEALRLGGLFRLHAAASLIRGGWLFVAPSGVGKTTTALRAQRARHPLLAQDLVWFDARSGTLLRGDRGLHVTRATAEEFGDLLGGVEWKETVRQKLYVPYERLPLAYAPDEIPLSAVVSLRRDEVRIGGSRWSPLPRAEAAMALWSSASLPLTRAGRQATADAIRDLVRATKRYRLELAGPVDFAEAEEVELA